MITINPKLKDRIDKTISSGNEVVFVAYSILEKFEEGLKYVVSKALKNNEHDDIFPPIFTCIKELTTNAIKANIKKILIDEGTIADPNNASDTVAKIKSVLNEKSMLEYAIKCRQNKLSVRVYVKIVNKQLHIRVINPVPLNESQNKRIQEKIITAKRYGSLAEFYLENPDPMAEGMGLGLSLIVVILKGANIENSTFTVESDKKTSTCATLIIPAS